MRLAQALRVLLPLGALVLLSTVFLVSRSIDPERAVAMADIDVVELARAPRIGTARVATVTQEETALVITADTVRALEELQEGMPMRLMLDTPAGTLDFLSGRQIVFSAREGEFDQLADHVLMREAVDLRSSDGYVVQMPRLISALSTLRIEGDGGVTGHGPPGEISAQRLLITPAPDAPDGYVLAFTGDVRLIYDPQD